VKVIEPDGRLVQMNAAGLAMLEVESIDEARAHGVLNFVQQDFRERFVALDAARACRRPGVAHLSDHGPQGHRALAGDARDRLARRGRAGDFAAGRDPRCERAAEGGRGVATRALYGGDRATIAIFWVRRDATIADANAAACGLLGYTRDELVRLRVPDFDPELLEERWPQHWEDLKSKPSVTFDSQLRRKDGSVIEVVISDHRLDFGGEELKLRFCGGRSPPVAGPNSASKTSTSASPSRCKAPATACGIRGRYGKSHLGRAHVCSSTVMPARPSSEPPKRGAPASTRSRARSWTNASPRFSPANRSVISSFRIVRAADGVERIVEANGSLQRDAAGRPQRLVGDEPRHHRAKVGR